MTIRRFVGVLLLLHSLGSCNPGNYDAGCDPKVDNLGVDVCNKLNASNMGCMVYQCDRQSSTCLLGPRDFDRDGDPDVLCGGTDCNDYDKRVNGLNKTCSCTGGASAGPCTTGVGVCAHTGQYMCSGTMQLTCPDPIKADDTYHDKIDSQTQSWDFNCDGMIQYGCTNSDMSVSACPEPIACTQAFTSAVSRTQYDVACQDYCSHLMGSDPKCSTSAKNIVLCMGSSACGQLAVTCHCMPIGVGQTASCASAGSSAANSILCK
jgi:hypothetical protein